MQELLNYIKKNSRLTIENILIFLKWVAIAIVVGSIVGFIGCVFYLSMHRVTDFRMSHSYILFFLPLAGLVIVFLYRICGVYESRGTNLVLMAVRTEEDVPLRMAPLIFISTVLTHLFGGSAGREGAALQLGGSIAQQLGRWLHLDRKDMHIITMCGMSACFSALFGTPVAAAIFALEVVSVGVMYYAALVPCSIAAVISVLIARSLQIPPASFVLSGVPQLSVVPLVRVLIFGAFCAAISILFCKVLSHSGRLAKKYIPNQYLRIAVGGAAILVLTLILRTDDYLGAGTSVIHAAMEGDSRPEAFILKMIFTAITLSAGFKGGETVPSFFIGATFGAVVGPLLGLDPSFCAALGLIAVFCGVTNCPITSALIGFELFGFTCAPYLLIICAVSYMLSGYTGLYSKQKIIYSKYKPVYINTHAKH